jgi:hypothetical protein
MNRLVNVVMLPTKEHTYITLGGSINKDKLGIVIPDNRHSESAYNCYVDNLEKGKSKYPQNSAWLNFQHLYLTSHENIQMGDWVIKPDGTIHKMSNGDMVDYLSSMSKATQKIIATTDKKLGIKIAFGTYAQVPQIDESFVKEYVESQGTIKQVLVELNECRPVIEDDDLSYKGYETLFNVKTNPDNTVIIHRAENDTKTYTHQEVVNIVRCAFDASKREAITANQWIEENLTK